MHRYLRLAPEGYFYLRTDPEFWLAGVWMATIEALTECSACRELGLTKVYQRLIGWAPQDQILKSEGCTTCFTLVPAPARQHCMLPSVMDIPLAFGRPLAKRHWPRISQHTLITVWTLRRRYAQSSKTEYRMKQKAKEDGE